MIIIEHFREHVAGKIAGRAKAMVVTRSRLHAVRYQRAFERYINRQVYKQIKSLVAFSGTVDDEGEAMRGDLGRLPDRASLGEVLAPRFREPSRRSSASICSSSSFPPVPQAPTPPCPTPP